MDHTDYWAMKRDMLFNVYNGQVKNGRADNE